MAKDMVMKEQGLREKFEHSVATVAKVSGLIGGFIGLLEKANYLLAFGIGAFVSGYLLDQHADRGAATL